MMSVYHCQIDEQARLEAEAAAEMKKEEGERQEGEDAKAEDAEAAKDDTDEDSDKGSEASASDGGLDAQEGRLGSMFVPVSLGDNLLPVAGPKWQGAATVDAPKSVDTPAEFEESSP